MWKCILSATLWFVLVAPSSANPCLVGDSLATPTLAIDASPPCLCSEDVGTGIIGSILGRANNVDTTRTRILLFAETTAFFVQPFADERRFTSIRCDGTFENDTRPGFRYWAVLADTSWIPSGNPLVSLPEIDGTTILAITCSVNSAPCPPARTLVFSGLSWKVKSACCRVGPGPNLFSDSDSSVWVDSLGLHLKLRRQGDQWFNAEVIADSSLGHGIYSFQLATRVDSLPRPVVVSGFTFDPGTLEEIDFEFAGDALVPGAGNSQHVVQPFETCFRSIFSMPPVTFSSHTFVWQPSHVSFASWRGHGAYPPGDPGDLIDASTLFDVSCVPPLGEERMRFNLWLFDEDSDGLGDPPPGGQELEIVVTGFSFTPDVTPVDDGVSVGLGVPVTVHQNLPNPFHDATVIRYRAAVAGEVRIEIFNLAGRRVRRLLDSHGVIGEHAVTWDGRDDSGKSVPAGAYWFRVSLGHASVVRRMVLIR